MSEKRYTRQIQLREFGPKAQQKLSEARILVVGVGGLALEVIRGLENTLRYNLISQCNGCRYIGFSGARLSRKN